MKKMIMSVLTALTVLMAIALPQQTLAFPHGGPGPRGGGQNAVGAVIAVVAVAAAIATIDTRDMETCHPGMYCDYYDRGCYYQRVERPEIVTQCEADGHRWGGYTCVRTQYDNSYMIRSCDHPFATIYAY